MLQITEPQWNGLSCIVPLFKIDKQDDFVGPDNINFFEKPEFHITIIGNSLAKEILDTCSKAQIKSLKEDINDFQFKFLLTDKKHFLEKQYIDHIRYSYITEIKFLNFEIFSKEISNIIGFNYSLFPHITTHSNATSLENKHSGIGIQSENDFNLYKL